jgi:3-hydroxy-9,10-secoandrosta-1,3,5(10)-triene-9,17-dione monooxygenase
MSAIAVSTAEKCRADIPPTSAEIISRARAMIPKLRERAAADEQARRICDETIAEMQAAGFFRVLQAKRWGGYEMSPEVFAEVQIALAEGDMSVAWVYGVVALHPYHLCLLDDRAAADVWSEDSSLLISSPYMPGGVAKRVDGGFEISGRWSYSSGSDHCPWTFLGGIVEGDPSDYRAFLLPRRDCRFVDTWHTLGLAATGSHDVVVEKAFIPEYRTHRFSDGFKGTNPGRDVNDALIFRMPFMLVFLRAITNAQIGALQAMLDLFVDYSATKKSMGKPLAQDPDVQLAVADALAGIFEMKSSIYATFAKLNHYAARNEFPPMQDRLMLRHLGAQVGDRCVKLAEQLVQASGGGLVYNKSGFGRIYRNMLAARQHIGAGFRTYGRTSGAALFGQPIDDILC